MSGVRVPAGGPNAVGAVDIPRTNLRLPDGRVLRRIAVPEVMGAMMQRQRMRALCAWASDDGLRVLASLDASPHGLLAHASLSYADHLPTWDDVRDVRDALFPDTVDFMLMLPKRADYVNLHEYTLQLMQCPTAWGIS